MWPSRLRRNLSEKFQGLDESTSHPSQPPAGGIQNSDLEPPVPELIQARKTTESRGGYGSKCDFFCLDGRYNKKGDYELKPSTLPLDAEAQDDRAWAEYAIISTRLFDQKGKQYSSTLEITSPHILKALRSVAPYYPDAPVITKKGVTYEHPYTLLVHCFRDLQDHRDQSVDDDVKLHISLLIRVIRLEMGAKLDTLEALLSVNKITYALAWIIFRPGKIVYTEINDAPEQYRVHSSEYVARDMGTVKFLRVFVEQIDFDGKEFRARKSFIIISAFNGVAPIVSLAVYPSEFHPEYNTTIQSIAERGHKWYGIQTAAPKTMTLNSICKCVGKDNKAIKFAVSS